VPTPPPKEAFERLFREMPPTYAAIASELRAVIRGAGPDLKEVVKWNNPFWVGTAPVLCLQCFPDHLNLGVMRGAELVKEFSAIEGTGKSMRHVKVDTVRQARSGEVARIVRAAIALDRRG
jgi:hypothetical protein